MAMRRAHEEDEAHPVGAGTEAGVEPDAEHAAEGDRGDDRRVADHDGLVAVAPQAVEVEVETDEEHEQHQPDLSQHLQRADHLGREERG